MVGNFGLGIYFFGWVVKVYVDMVKNFLGVFFVFGFYNNFYWYVNGVLVLGFNINFVVFIC